MLPFILIGMNILTKRDMSATWECNRCGDCCKYVAGKDEWKYAEISKTQMQVIGSIVTATDYGCEALVDNCGKYSCLVHSLYGFEGKPPGCRGFTEIRCNMTAKIKEVVKARL